MEELKPFFTFLDRVKYSSELAAHQGWTKADKLPEGWMKRISEASNHVLFLSPQGRVFQNKASVTMFLNGGQVDEEVLGETKEVKMKGMEVKEEDWLEDASLPTGWSLRMTSDKSKLIRAPGGKMYTTRLDAIKSLLELDANKEEVALMKEGLKEDGWEVVEYLPSGWMLRKVKRKMKNEYKTEYMTPQLTILKSIRDLILSMKELGVDEEGRMKALSHKWKLDVDLPPGILTNKAHNQSVGHNTFDSYLTIDGLFFQSIYHLLRHLHVSDPGQEEVVRSGLTKQGFHPLASLPSGWLYKPALKPRLTFLSPNYHRLSSMEEVLTHLSENGATDPGVIENFKAEVSSLLEKQAATFSQVSKPAKAAKSGNLEWSEDPSLPDGWKFAPYNPKLLNMQNKKLCKYLSPVGDFFNSKPAALRWMLSSKASAVDLEKMEAGLEEEGYSSSPNLPKGWRIKTGPTWFVYLSPNFETFNTVKKCRAYMEENGYEESTIKLLENHYNMVKREAEDKDLMAKRNEEEVEDETETWEEHYLLPNGWKFTLGTDGAPIFLTEDNIRMKSLKVKPFLLRAFLRIFLSQVAKMRVRNGRMGLSSQAEARILSNLICFAARSKYFSSCFIAFNMIDMYI